jgi:hypothetical protein
MGGSLGGVRLRLECPLIGADGKDEVRPEGVGRAQEIAEVDGLGDAFDADGEITAGSWK